MVVSTVICTSRHEDWLVGDHNYPLAPYYGPKSTVEKLVCAAGFKNYTILRPAWLMHNYLDFMPKYNWPNFEENHILEVSYAPSTKLSHLSPGDVAKFAAASPMDPEKFNGHKIGLAGENLTLDEVARHLSTAAGVEITTKFRTPEETALVSPADLPGIMYQLTMARSPSVYEVDVHKLERYGIKLTSFAEYFEEEKNKEALRRTLRV